MEQIKRMEKKLIDALPADRGEQSFWSFIACRFEDYLELLNNLPANEINYLLSKTAEMAGEPTKRRLVNLIKEIQNQCRVILQYAYRGDLNNALILLEKLLLYRKYTQNKLNDYYVNYFRIESDEQCYFRCVDHSKEKDNVNCWHVPFELRYKVEKSRFNQIGYPCFYIASSENAAYAETGGVKDGCKRWCGKYRPKKLLYYLDFTLPSIENMTLNDHFSFIVTYPIRLMCLTIAKNNSNFCDEYLFSQLFFHVLFFHKNDKWPHFDGIRYVSMHDRYSTCIVVPALYKTKNPPESGYSDFILESFDELEKPRVITPDEKSK